MTVKGLDEEFTEFKEAAREAALEWCLADDYPTGNSGFIAGAKWAREHLIPKPETFKNPEEALAKSIEARIDQMNEELFTQGVTTNNRVSRPLNIETLRKLSGELRRHTHIYVASTTFIPEDALGILYVRPEDAEKVKQSCNP